MPGSGHDGATPRRAAMGKSPRVRTVLTAVGAIVLALSSILSAQRLVYEVRSRYQLITVRDTPDGIRQLVFEERFPGTGALQSEMNLADHRELHVAYSRFAMAALPLAPTLRRLLIVGLGGASMQRYLHWLLPQATIETVELDPAVRDVATRFFYLREDQRQIVHVADGRRFLERSRDRYDIIFLDAFNANAIPFALTTEEFLRVVSRRLPDGGLVCANLWETSSEYGAMLATYAAVFPQVFVLHVPGTGNSIVVGLRKAGLDVADWMTRARAFERAYPTGLDLPALIQRGTARRPEPFAGSRILRDADAPVP
jgi:spermidine synthase